VSKHPYLRLQQVTVFVRDYEQSLRFYVEQLGFTVAFDARFQTGDRWVAVAPPDGSALLTLVVPKPNSFESQLIGRPTQVAFVSEDVAEQFNQWRQRGVRFLHTPRLRRIKYDRHAIPSHAGDPEPQDPVWGGVFTLFKDVDGNTFALVGFDESSREIETQRRITAEKLEAERRAAHELEIAQHVQARLFPQSPPPCTTLDYAGVCVQARQVGGDYYDFLTLSETRLGLVIGDISGKGIAAALLMANLQAILRSQCAMAIDQPQRLLRAANQVFCDSTPDGAYATLFFAEYEESTRNLRYINCGHLPALLLRSDGTLDRLESTCTVLGLFKDLDFAVNERQLAPGDTLVLYTDGITEAMNAAGEEFGEEALVEEMRVRREECPKTFVNSVVEAVNRYSRHEQHDDVTMIAAKCRR
jgi:serine phosphatase RsbU (regulator of sigma subunit)/catechol 2,3-dioxygenase-like lactoylglutathione lyase family enzyme